MNVWHSQGSRSLLDDYIKNRLFRLLDGSDSPRSTKVDGAFAVGSSLGAVRHENQDAALIVRARFAEESNRDFDLGIVCDGMGGMRGGREAAVLAVVTFLSELLEPSDLPAERRSKIALSHVNEVIFRRMHGAGGTTLSAAILYRNRSPVFAHAGDTRAYVVLSDQIIRQISQDDTLRAVLNKPSGEDDEQGSKLIQFVGMGEGFEPHVFVANEAVKSVLLTSDGVHGVAPSTFTRAVRVATSPHDVIRRLLQLSDVLGGLDNATALMMPATFDAGHVNQGCSHLRLMSPFEAVDILLPSPLPTAWSRKDTVAPTSRAVSQPDKDDVKEPPSRTSKPRAKRGKKGKKDTMPPAGELELKPPSSTPTPVSVEFPDVKGGP